VTSRVPEWFIALEERITARIDAAIALYPRNDRRTVVMAILRALHARADAVDPDGSWISIALDASGAAPGDDRSGLDSVPPLPSFADAEDVAEDVSIMSIPEGGVSPIVALRAAIHVAWTRHASELAPVDRALLAAEAASFA
jgi:hypothetical protein